MDRLEQLRTLNPTAKELASCLTPELIEELAFEYAPRYPIVLFVKWSEIGPENESRLQKAFEEAGLTWWYEDSYGSIVEHPAIIRISREMIAIATRLGLEQHLEIIQARKGQVIQKHYSQGIGLLEEDENSGGLDISDYIVR